MNSLADILTQKRDIWDFKINNGFTQQSYLLFDNIKIGGMAAVAGALGYNYYEE